MQLLATRVRDHIIIIQARIVIKYVRIWRDSQNINIIRLKRAADFFLFYILQFFRDCRVTLHEIRRLHPVVIVSDLQAAGSRDKVILFG